MAYMLGDVCDAPFVRLTPIEGQDPAIERFLRDAWAAHLGTGVGARLIRRRYHVRLQVEAEVVDGEVHRAFLEVIRGSRESMFDAVLFGAVRATGCLAGLPLAFSRNARSVVLDATFEVPDPPPEARAASVGEAFAAQGRDAIARLVRSGLLPAGPHDLVLTLERGPRERWHVDAARVAEPTRSLLLGALAGAGLLASPEEERLGGALAVSFRVSAKGPAPRPQTIDL